MTSDRNISLFQKILDAYHYVRKWIVTAVVYLSLRLYGSEVSFESLWSRTFDSAKHADLNLDEAKDLETLLGEAQANLKRVEARRAVVMDKCKVLFTLSTILLGAIGLLMPKAFAFSHSWMKVLFFFGTLAFVNVIVLLVFFFGVGNEMKVALTQDQVDLEEKDLKKCLINVYLKCGTATENRTDFLVELYKVAQFFFLTAFTIIALLFMLNFFTQSPDEEMKRALKVLRGDQIFIESIRGGKGEKGDAGAKGDKGDKGPQGERGENGDSGATMNLSQQGHTNGTPESTPK
jgi:hypothetical protein